jgi:hypothetical protein
MELKQQSKHPKKYDKDLLDELLKNSQPVPILYKTKQVRDLTGETFFALKAKVERKYKEEEELYVILCKYENKLFLLNEESNPNVFEREVEKLTKKHNIPIKTRRDSKSINRFYLDNDKTIYDFLK